MTSLPEIAFIDPDPATRHELEQVGRNAGFRAISFDIAERYLAECEPAELHCLVAGIRLAGMSGLELQQHLLAQGRRHPLIFLTELNDARSAMLALQYGAADYLVKPQTPEKVVRRASHILHKHERHLARKARYERLRRRIARLTSREKQVLQLIVEGQSSKQIAYALNLSDRTVSNHRLRIIEKTRAVNTADLVRIATFVQFCRTLWREKTRDRLIDEQPELSLSNG